MHPPYVARHELKGRGTKAWVVKALDYHRRTGNTVVVVLSVHDPIYMLLEAGAAFRSMLGSDPLRLSQ